MCGLTGFWDFKNKIDNKEHVLHTMLNTLVRRGPDSFGTAIMGDLALGHRRLSIVDLTPNGHQPMYSSTHRFVMSYNGNIFNTEELRILIPSHSWRGTSDTEVILELFETFGIEETVKKLIGMFAIALYDQQKKELTLIRDRIGIKPLYYGQDHDTFFFGSQVKSFLPHPFFKKEINQEALSLFLKYNYIPTPYSIYKNIFKLEPGHILTVQKNGETKSSCYWSMEQATLSGRQNLLRDPHEIKDSFEALLKDCVRRRMMADVPLGAFLSGGVDSSLIVSLMQEIAPRPIKTFTVGFYEGQYNEAPYALEVAKHLRTDHVEEYLPIDAALNIIPTIPEYCDEPFADASQIPTLLVSQMAKKHVTVALSGDGGDEFYAGYSRYFDVMRAQKILNRIPLPLRKVAASGYALIKDAMRSIVGPALAFRFEKAAQCFPYKTIEELYNVVFDFWPGLLERPSQKIVSSELTSHLSSMSYMQYHDSVHYLPDDILVKVDRCSMHASLEARVPFLDHRLVEFSWRIPDYFKYHRGTPKWLLKQILYKYVPKNLIERPKMGFGVPIDQWLRGPLRDWSFALLEDIRKDGILPYLPIEKRMLEHQKEKVNWQYSLWGILMWQQWKNHYGG